MSGGFSLNEIAAALDGEVAGRQVLAPGPGHSRRDRSLVVRPEEGAPGGILVFTHSPADDWKSCKSYVFDRLGLPQDDWRKLPPIDPLERMRARARREQEEAFKNAVRIRKAQALWSYSVDPTGTIVETHLASRALTLPGDLAMSVIRFHPAGAWRDEATDAVIQLPMMVAAMRNIRSNEITAVHRTALSHSGEKIGRKMYGVAAGAAVKLDADEAVSAAGELTIGEGIETTLSGRQLGYAPAWAMCSAAFIASLPVLVGVERLSVLEEMDESGTNARALAQVGTRWSEAGREVVAVRPATGKDMNDALRALRGIA